MDALEKIIRPIVEGQIRGFLKEHPSIIESVDWYKVPGRDPVAAFIGSLSKRIVRDLTCGSTAARLAEAFLALRPETPLTSTVELVACGEAGRDGTSHCPGRASAVTNGNCQNEQA